MHFMKLQFDMFCIVTDKSKFNEMKAFYRDVTGMEVEYEMGDDYVEFKHPGIRFAVSTNTVMLEITKHKSFAKAKQGQAVELAFLVDKPEEVDSTYAELIKKGAAEVMPAADMPWGQRAAFFADPDGNIHEVYANLPQ